MNTDGYLLVGEVARQIGARPRDVTQALYNRLLRDDLCPIVQRKRWIPESYVDEVARVMRRRGLIRTTATPPPVIPALPTSDQEIGHG